MSQIPPPPYGATPQNASASQPSPYVPMNPYGADPSRLNRKACRTAAILHFVLGGLGLLMGFCLIASGVFVSSGQMHGQDMSEIETLSSELGFPIGMLIGGFGVCSSIPSILYLVLGFFTLRGKRPAMIASMVVSSLLALLSLLNAGSILLGARESDPGSIAAGLALNAVFIAGLLAMFVALIYAYREVGATPSPQALYQAQLQQYYQQYYAMQQLQQPQQEPVQPAQQTPPPPPSQA